MSTINLKRHLNDNELDLSLQDLETVPVKRIIDLRKVTSLDLSCNLLSELPEDFGSLAFLQKLDLSKNRLTTLPSSFGDLTCLQQLDLRDNKISMLPPCFGRLRRLKWLDLKGNPMEPALKEAAGDCVKTEDCTRCAQHVVLYMRQVAARLQQERQERLERERQLAAIEKQRELEEKRLAKEERRKAYRRRLAEAEERRAAEADDEGAEEDEISEIAVSPSGDARDKKKPNKSSTFKWIFVITLVSIGALALFLFRHNIASYLK